MIPSDPKPHCVADFYFSNLKDKTCSPLIKIEIKISKTEKIELKIVYSPLSEPNWYQRIEYIDLFIYGSAKTTKLSENFAVKKAHFDFDFALIAHESQLRNLTQTLKQKR